MRGQVRCHAGVVTGVGESLSVRLDDWTVRHPDSPLLRVLLRAPKTFWRLGLGRWVSAIEVRGGHLVLLTVRGRSSGVPRHAPVVTHSVEGRTYLWCPYGSRAQWYRNVIANPVVTVQSSNGTHTLRAVRIGDMDEAIAVVSELRRFDRDFLHSYLAAEGIADVPEDIASNFRRLHLQRLEPTSGDGPPPLRADLVWFWLVPAVIALNRVMRWRHRGSAAYGGLGAPS